jgi:hypothetical protein
MVLVGNAHPTVLECCAAYIDAIVAWQSSGDDTQLKNTIAKCVESSLVEILSLAGEDL